MHTDEATRRILDALDSDRLTADLVALIRTGSVTGTAPESGIQHEIAELLGGIGLTVDLWEIDVEAVRADPAAPGDETDRTQAHGLVAVTGEGRPGLILCGHVDVVPIGDPLAWTEDPFGGRIEGDLVYGRGACDMKAGVAANLAVARAVQASGVRLARPLAVHTVVSEEDGGLGAFATLQRGHTGDAAVITEPTDGRMVIASAGALTFRLEVVGLAAHGSNRASGVSALEKLWSVHRALIDLETRRNAEPDPRFPGNPLPYALSIGTVHAGDWASTVPDRLVVEGRYGVRIGEDPAVARAEFETVVAGACAEDDWLATHPVAVSWPGGQFASGWIDGDDPLLDDLSAAVEVERGAVPVRVAAPYGSDQRLYTGAGIPTVLYGPGELVDAHARDEKVSLADTLAVARVLAVLVAQRCGATV